MSPGCPCFPAPRPHTDPPKRRAWPGKRLAELLGLHHLWDSMLVSQSLVKTPFSPGPELRPLSRTGGRNSPNRLSGGRWPWAETPSDSTLGLLHRPASLPAPWPPPQVRRLEPQLQALEGRRIRDPPYGHQVPLVCLTPSAPGQELTPPRRSTAPSPGHSAQRRGAL